MLLSEIAPFPTSNSIEDQTAITGWEPSSFDLGHGGVGLVLDFLRIVVSSSKSRVGMQQASWDGHSGEPNISDDSRLLPATTPFLSQRSARKLDPYPSRIHDLGLLTVSLGILFVEFVCKLTHIVFVSSSLRRKPEQKQEAFQPRLASSCRMMRVGGSGATAPQIVYLARFFHFGASLIECVERPHKRHLVRREEMRGWMGWEDVSEKLG